jgi:hypothetical protein
MPMRAGHVSATILGLRRAACLVLPALVAGAVVAAPAVASTPAPEYSLSIVEGASTQPEDPILHVSGYVEPKAEIAVSIAHNGLVVVKNSSDNGGVWLSQVPQIGDVVTLESPSA